MSSVGAELRSSRPSARLQRVIIAARTFSLNDLGFVLAGGPVHSVPLPQVAGGARGGLMTIA